jgi:hypothetical protein
MLEQECLCFENKLAIEKSVAEDSLTCLNTWGELEELEKLDAQAGLCFIPST